MDVTLDYVHSRRQFNTRIGEFQLMQGHLANMYTQLSSNRAFTYSVAHKCDQGKISPMVRRSELSLVGVGGLFFCRSFFLVVAADCATQQDCAAVILSAAEAATQVALTAIQCLGMLAWFIVLELSSTMSPHFSTFPATCLQAAWATLMTTRRVASCAMPSCMRLALAPAKSAA